MPILKVENMSKRRPFESLEMEMNIFDYIDVTSYLPHPPLEKTVCCPPLFYSLNKWNTLFELLLTTRRS